MKTISKSQLISLWVSGSYFFIAFMIIGARASWGFLRLASEYREDLVPREVLFGVAQSASQDFWNFTILIGIGFAYLLVNIIWISQNKRI